MRDFRKTLCSVVLASAVMPGMVAADESWTVNYTDANTAGALGIILNNTVSAVTDEYKYTAESVVAFNDNDNSGGISGGDTFDDYVGFIIDQLNFGSINTFDTDYALGNVQITGVITATGLQLDALNYIVTSAKIDFYFDGALSTFADFDTLVDGVYVQSGDGTGAGVNGALVPDGAIDINFSLTDVLSTLGDFGNFELFDPFVGLDEISFNTDSNNNACPPASCGSSVADIESFFDFATGDYDFFFHTRSDGSAIKEQIPEPEILALFGLGMLGFGLARRKVTKS